MAQITTPHTTTPQTTPQIIKPENLFLENLLSYTENKTYGKEIYGLVHLIMKHQIENTENGCGGYVNIHSSKLKQVITTHKYGDTLRLQIKTWRKSNAERSKKKSSIGTKKSKKTYVLRACSKRKN